MTMTINPHANDSYDDVYDFILQGLGILRKQLSEAIDRERLLSSVEAARFSGENPTAWIHGIERYFDLSLATESDRLELVPLLIDSPASEWLSFFQMNNSEASWQEFLLALRHHFDPDFYEDYVDQIFEEELKLAPQSAASHAKSHTNGPHNDDANALVRSTQEDGMSLVAVPTATTSLVARSNTEVQPKPAAVSSSMKVQPEPPALPDSKATALPDSTTIGQHDQSLLFYCGDGGSLQFGAENGIHIFDP